MCKYHKVHAQYKLTLVHRHIKNIKYNQEFIHPSVIDHLSAGYMILASIKDRLKLPPTQWSQLSDKFMLMVVSDITVLH